MEVHNYIEDQKRSCVPKERSGQLKVINYAEKYMSKSAPLCTTTAKLLSRESVYLRCSQDKLLSPESAARRER